MRVLLTGANGFVGRVAAQCLSARPGFEVIAAARSSPPAGLTVAEAVQIAGLDEHTDWSQALASVQVVVHAAARVHVMNDASSDPLAEFRRVNVAGTLRLARQAAEAGVRRFIFISSIKVNGESTEPGRPYRADDRPEPCDPYGISKMEAERGLLEMASETGMEVVIIRPVLVYGPGVKANFLSMMKWLSKDIPLPFGAIHNKRSLVALDNLVDLIATCVDHPKAANQIFLASDGEDLSTTDLLCRMSRALGKRPRLLSVPVWVLEFAASVFGKKSISQRLCGSLQVDISHTRKQLGWTPPVSVDAALKKTAERFLES